MGQPRHLPGQPSASCCRAVTRWPSWFSGQPSAAPRLTRRCPRRHVPKQPPGSHLAPASGQGQEERQRTKEVCRWSMSDGFWATAIVIVSGPLERGRTPPCDLLSSPLRPSVSRSVELLQCTCSGHIDLSYACFGILHLQEYQSSCRHPVPIVAHPQFPLPATPRLPATPPPTTSMYCTSIWTSP